MDNVICILEKYLKNGDTVIIACSAGPDSMCLLSLVQNLRIKLNIICAHINHKVRKKSDEEYIYVKNYCKEHNIIFEGTEIKDKITNNFESMARNFRYNFLEKLKDKYSAKYILTAHHGDDLMETILMRITRGSNLLGYAGIKEIDGNYFRPLLSVSKDEILEYLKNNKIKYYWDNTNDEDTHTRNRYRHHVLPFLKSENPKVHEKYLKFSKELQAYDNLITKIVLEKQLIHDNKISVTKISSEDKLIQKKAIELLIKEIQKTSYLEVSDKTIDSIIKEISSKKSNTTLNLSNGYIVKKNYDEITICKDVPNKDFLTTFTSFFENDNWKIFLVAKSDEKSNFVLRLNSKEIKLPLIIRNRRLNDKIQVKNLGTKKLKDIFIDSKVPRQDRNEWIIILDSDNNILWLPGLKKSKFDKEKNEKYDIILTCERK